MNNPSKNPDDITKALIKDQMAEQGIEILSRGPTKDAEDAKNLTEEAKWEQGDVEKETSPSSIFFT